MTWRPITLGPIVLEADHARLADPFWPERPPEGGVTRAEWDRRIVAEASEAWSFVEHWGNAAPWYAADMYNLFAERRPDLVEQIIRSSPWSRATVERWSRVATLYGPGERAHIETVSISKHQAIAKLPEEDRRPLLEQAAAGGLSVAEIRQHGRERRRERAPVEEPTLGTYRVLYANPDWSEQTIDSLAALPVGDVMAEQAAAFIWVDEDHRGQIDRVLEAWGFEHQAAFIWDGVLHRALRRWSSRASIWNSERHYHLVWATRGGCLADTRVPLEPSIVPVRADDADEKPEAFRELVERLYTRGPYLEVFALRRLERPGWAVYGPPMPAAAGSGGGGS